MFEGVSTVIDKFIEEAEAAMKLRETPEYKKRFDRFGEALKAYYESEGELNGLEELMLSAFSMAKWLRATDDIKLTHFTAKQRPIDTAIMECAELMDAPLEHCVPIYKEADALDELSFSAFMMLKKAGEIIYCKHCKGFLNAPCAAHKPPSTVYDMYYCSGCKGFIEQMCVYHGPECCGPAESLFLSM